MAQTLGSELIGFIWLSAFEGRAQMHMKKGAVEMKCDCAASDFSYAKQRELGAQRRTNRPMASRYRAATAKYNAVRA